MSINLKILFLLPMLMLLVPISYIQAESIRVRNNVKSSANSGGNTGENIQTGDATASSSVKTNISGTNEIKVETEVSAEANGEKVEVKTESTEPVSQKIEESVGGASVSVENEINNNLETEQYIPVEPAKTEETTIISAIKNFFNKIIALL